MNKIVNIPTSSKKATPPPTTPWADLKNHLMTIFALLLSFLRIQFNDPLRVRYVLGALLIASLFLQVRNPWAAAPQIVYVPEGTTLLVELPDTSSPPVEKASRVSAENEAAPEMPKVGSPDTQAYITRFAEVAITEMKKYGIPASISLAQGIIESRSGTSKLAVTANNHFGIRCFSTKCKKGHCTNFSDDNHKNFFRKYSNAWESWRAHSQILDSGQYANLKKYGRDYKRWAVGLISCGYATSRTYAEDLVSVIERYDLHKYDK